MKLGLFTVLFPELDLEELLSVTGQLGITAIELSAKANRGLRHFDPLEIEKNEQSRIRFLDRLKRTGTEISQLNCSCNPVSPYPGGEEEAKEYFLRTFRLAGKLGVHTVGTFSGCPAGGPKDQKPNWITCPWPPEFLSMLEWQWEEKLIPFWSWAVKEGAEYGVNRFAIEMHPGFCVYNPETLLKLRHCVGPEIGVNLDPSHLIWQGIDLPEAIHLLEGAIWHVHAKDTFVDAANVRKNGNIDCKHYSRIRDRSWTFRSVGNGMPREKWIAMIYALRQAGYDGVLSIEHEDMLMSKMEGLSKAAGFLKSILPQDPPEPMWWA